VYMGEVVNQAAKLAARGGKGFLTPALMVQPAFYSNLNERNQGLLQLSSDRTCYQGEVISTGMEAWLKENVT